MKKIVAFLSLILFVSACTSLTYQERQTLRSLKANGISVEYPAGNWERSASPGAAGFLNILPGVGNFYLAAGNGGDSSQYLYGFLNLLTWPISVVWGVPEGVIDANRINERELVYFYTYDEQGRLALQDRNLSLNNRGVVVKYSGNKYEN